MRLRSLILIAALRIALVSAYDYSPFQNAFYGLSEEAPLVKRQGCEAGLNSCSSLGANVCCSSGYSCTLDQVGHVACCSIGATCTGTIAGSVTGSTATSSSTGIVFGGTTPTSTTTASGGVVITGVGGGGSTVPNSYYPFLYAPSSFPDADQCSSAFTSCQSASTACFTSLAGINGVTIGGLGGGITVQGTSGVVLSTVSSICSSLSSVGCSNIQQVSQCTVYGSGSGVTPTTITTGAGGFVTVGNNGPRQTACPRMIYAAGAGAVLGAMGAVI